jgi:hypothetical protein
LVIKQGEMILLSANKFDEWDVDRVVDGDVGFGVNAKDGSSAEVEFSGGELKSIRFAPVPTTHDIIAACLSFRVILPDSDSKSVNVPLGFARLQSQPAGGIVSDKFPRISAPVILLKR